jgi:hypothetical protein
VQDLDRQVVALFPQEILALLLEDNTGPVMGVDDVIALVEIRDELDLLDLLEAGLDRFFYCFGNRCLLT